MKSSAKNKLIHLMRKNKHAKIILPFDKPSAKSFIGTQKSESTRRRAERREIPGVPSSKYMGYKYPYNMVEIDDGSGRKPEPSIRDYINGNY